MERGRLATYQLGTRGRQAAPKSKRCDFSEDAPHSERREGPAGEPVCCIQAAERLFHRAGAHPRDQSVFVASTVRPG